MSGRGVDDLRPGVAARQHRLRAAMRGYVARDDGRGYRAVAIDFAAYGAATALAVWIDSTWIALACACVAGIMTSTLFVLGHDATHGSLVASPRANRVLARLLLLPALHNYTLWRLQHNRLHHLSPNVKGINSWSPLAPDEYRALPGWRRGLERVYRGGGFGLYYLVERWWKHKLLPRAGLDVARRAAAWRDAALVAAWLALLGSILVLLGDAAGRGWAASLARGLVVPFLVWNVSMGLTVFLQHTHAAVPWFRDAADAAAQAGQDERTVHVRFPRWYGLLSHDVMEHAAHHVNPLIPFHRLHAAQTRLVEIEGDGAIVEAMSLRYLGALLRRCKLYDYDRHAWTDFEGTATTAASVHRPVHDRAA
jgi:omega-6 fatty acid desaturase (delta-12 desaturase)